MSSVQVLWYYIVWHYTKAWHDLFRIVSNYLWFIGNYFSLGLLFQTLFSPWRRMNVVGGKGMIDSFIGALLINMFMRGVGFLIRSATILVGMLVLAISVVLSAVVIIAWQILPIAVFILFFAGAGQILKAFF